MSQACIKAYHEMEERYARLIIEYFNLEQKEAIFHATNDLIKELKVYPSQTMQPKGEFEGEFTLEFNDDYDKVAGDFFEAIIKKLAINQCEIG
jgi:hypothetical protein